MSPICSFREVRLTQTPPQGRVGSFHSSVTHVGIRTNPPCHTSLGWRGRACSRSSRFSFTVSSLPSVGAREFYDVASYHRNGDRLSRGEHPGGGRARITFTRRPSGG